MRVTHLAVPAAFLLACAPQVDYAAEEERIRELDQQWVAAVAEGDTAAIANLYAEDGYFMPPNQRWAEGRSTIRQAWAGLFAALPNAQLTFAPTEIEVAEAGDLAYDIGTYNLAFDGPGGRVEDIGKYVVVWRKIDGEWKAVADIFNSDNPAP